MTLRWLFDRMLASEAPALVWCDREIAAGALVEEVGRWERVLDESGVESGRVVSVEADVSPRAVALMLALAQRSCVIVPLGGGRGAHREAHLRISEAQTSISLDRGDAHRLEHRPISVAHPLTRRLVSAKVPGLVIFTSGSEGEPRAALHDLSVYMEKFRTARRPFRMLTFLRLDAIGGINTLLHSLSSGGSLVVPEAREPEAVCAAVARHRVEVLPATPTFLNLMLMSGAHQRHDLSSLKRISYGTEVMTETTLQRLRDALPHVDLLQMYGLSELGILHTKSESPGSVWIRLGGDGYETKIVDGTLRIRARSSMLGYLNAPNPFDAEGWFDTEDHVEARGDFVRILGRRSQVINVGGQKVHPAEIESVLMAAPNVADAVVRGEANPIVGQVVVASVNLVADEEPGQLAPRLRRFCRERLAEYKVPIRIEIALRPQHGERHKKMRRPPDPA